MNMTPPSPLLQGLALHFRYPNQAAPVLQNADFQLGHERLGLIGANGSGKTTLLQLLMGLMRPQQGEIRCQGERMDGEKDFRKLRNVVGFVFQNPDDQLFMPTVLEDVAFGPLNQGLSPKAARQRARETLQSLGLAGFEERITHRLSGGEKRLVSLATTLSMRPKALLLDEPTNDLDPETRERLVGLLRELPLAMCVVSHDYDFLRRTVDRLLILEKGKLLERDAAVLHSHVHAHPGGDAEHMHGESSAPAKT